MIHVSLPSRDPLNGLQMSSSGVLIEGVHGWSDDIHPPQPQGNGFLNNNITETYDT